MMNRLSMVATAIGDWFKANAKLLVACFAVGLICHFQLYSQGLTVSDGLVSVSNLDGYGWYVPDSWDISLGRWGLCLAAFAKSGLCSPALVSAITLALFSVGIVALVGLLGIRKTCLRYLTAILLICTPFISGTLAYYYCSNSYALCFLCAVLAVCLQGAVGSRWGFWRIAESSLLLMFALGCYQAGMGVFCAAGLLVLFVAVLGGVNPKSVITHFCKLLAVLVVGVLLYAAVNSAVLVTMDISMGSYVEASTANASSEAAGIQGAAAKAASSISLDNIVSQLPKTVVLAYGSFFSLLFSHGVFGNGFYESKIMVLLALVVAVLFVASVVMRGRKGVFGSVLAFACVALLPLAANIVLIAAPDYGSPTIPMVGGFVVSLALLPALVQACCVGHGDTCSLERAESAYLSCPKEGSFTLGKKSSAPLTLGEGVRKAALVVSIAALALLAWSYVLQCNADSEIMELERNQVRSLTVRAVDALESNAVVQAGAKVAIIGVPESGNYPKTSSFRDVGSAYTQYGLIWGGSYSNNCRAWKALVRQYAGVSLNVCTIEELKQIGQSDAFAAMASYPNDGCITEINGVVVLKFSDSNGWG